MIVVNLKKEKGITLIALVITIIVLLILAGISITSITGKNGLLTQAENAKENTRGEEIQEYINLTISENEIANNTGENSKSRYKVIQELYKKEKLTDEEVEQLNKSDHITIGNLDVDFSGLEDIVTLGDVYNEDMIGQKITYSSNNVSDWIIFGKDSNENILITSATPLASDITVEDTPLGWLTYEDNLNEKCSIYGGVIQKKTVTARSITLEDINNITNYKPPEKETITFGKEDNIENNKVKMYFPSLNASSNGYWQNPEVETATFYCNTNRYAYDNSELKPNISKILLGETDNKFSYLVGDKSILIDEVADFSVSVVYGGAIQSHWYAYYYGVCYSNATKGYSYSSVTDSISNIRPIVVLPNNIEVEQNTELLWDIKN